MSRLRVLFIGGTGIISSACVREAVARDVEVFVLNRGRSADRPLPAGVRELRADAREPRSVRAAIDGLDFDCVVDFVAFAPEHVQADIDLFTGRTGLAALELIGCQDSYVLAERGFIVSLHAFASARGELIKLPVELWPSVPSGAIWEAPGHRN